MLFWAYVVAALQSANPDVGATARSLLEAPHPSVDAIVATLLNDLHAVDHDVVLVLDDYHVIDAPEIHEAVALLLAHLPPHVHLVIASRADPPLPLAALRAGGDLLEVRAADLRFTGDEAAAYLNDAMDLTLAAADIELLEARTEGWIAALQLAALSMQGRDDVAGFIAAFAGDDRFILDYLVGEVLDRQSTAVRSFLLETCILSRLTGPLCDAVTGRHGSRATLEQLERANLFLVPLDDRRTWYRYHHLFGDVLRAHLLDEDPDQVSELHRRASDWYDKSGDHLEAITHAMAGEHFERAGQLIELAAPEMSQRRQEVTARRWLEALPDDVFRNRPVLAITLVGARMATGDPTGVEPLLRLVESSLESSIPPPIVFDVAEFHRLPARLSMYRAALALLSGDIGGTIAHATRALDLADPTDHLGQGSATALLGLAHWATGELEAAERWYVDAIECLIAAERFPDVLGCSLALADIQIAQGRLGDATRTFESGLRWTTEHPALRGAADMHVGMSEVLIDRNELDAAAQHLEASIELGEQAGLPQNTYRWRVATARLRHAHGDLDGALEMLDEAQPLYDTDFSPPVRPVAALRARVQLARGDLDAALGWVAERALTPDDDLAYLTEFEHLTLARILLAQYVVEQDGRTLDDALRLLNRLLGTADDGHRTGSAIEALILLSSAHGAGNDVEAAIAALREALGRAEPEGHTRVFLDAGPTVASLLRSLPTHAAMTPHLRRIIAASHPAHTPTRSPSGLVDDLSPRELDVLRMLRGELSGPQIASELLVSLNTFRSHTKSIYAKLGVNNRREAIRRGTELGL
ncbi:MAG: ATP-dependent transcriptional regulator, MalT-like, LuxR family [Acidimicrobiales bacterium]|nr:ATP-dependent transcriptional regulator, MalT-like, LuxR family [Acidimicrobiales bacterium]